MDTSIQHDRDRLASRSSTADGTVKINTACKRCRTKKRKCEGTRPECRACRLAGETCVYASVPKRRGPIAGISRTLERRLAILQAFLGFVLQACELGDGGLNRPLVSLASEFVMTTVDVTRLTELRDRYSAELGLLNSFELPDTSDTSGTKMTGITPRKALDKLFVNNRLEQLERVPSETESESETPSDPGDRQAFIRPSFRGESVPVPATTWPPSILAADYSQTLREGFVQHEVPEPIFAGRSGQTTLRGDMDLATGEDISIAAVPTRLGSVLDPYPQDTVPALDFPDLAFAEATLDYFEAMPFGAAFDLDYDAVLSTRLEMEDQARFIPTVVDLNQSVAPPRDVQYYLVEHVTAHYQSLLPFLTIDGLRSSKTSQDDLAVPHDATLLSANLILATCAFGLCVAPSAGGLTTHVDSLEADVKAGGSLSAIWSEQVKTSVLSDVLRGKYTLDTVATMILIALREQGDSNDSQAWLWTGVAVRVAQNLGLQDPGSHGHSWHAKDSARASQIWSSICLLETSLGLQLGRPCTTGGPPVSIPNEVEMVDRASTGTSSVRSLAMNHVTDVCSILDDISRQAIVNSSLSHSGAEDSMGKLRKRLQNWRADLPDHLRGLLGDEIGAELGLLLLLYYMGVLSSHGMFR